MVNEYCCVGGDLILKNVRIMPEDVQELIDSGKLSRTRGFSPTRCKEYAYIIANEKFQYTPDSIAFDENGFLLNGNTRLLACLMAGIPFTSKVDFNAIRNQYQDQGRTRNLTHNLQVNKYNAGCGHYGKYADGKFVAMYKQILNHFGIKGRFTTSNTDTFDTFYNTFSEYIDAFCDEMIFAWRYKKNDNLVYSAPFLAACFIAYVNGRASIDELLKLQTYLHDLDEGKSCRDTYKGSEYAPVFMLHRHYIQNILADGKNKEACFMDTLVTIYCIKTRQEYKYSKNVTKATALYFQMDYSGKPIRYTYDWKWISMK